MTVHVLDTSAVILLLKKHKPRLRVKLESVGGGEGIVIPAPVLVELGQAREASQRALADLLEIADVEALVARVAKSAAAGLRAVTRPKCETCSGFGRPSWIDAVVMALASDFVEEAEDEAIVYTQDMDDFEVLRAQHFRKVTVANASSP
jgi:predicted nucleic acid-binding protein